MVAIQAQLGATEAVLQYLLLEQEGYLFAITANDIRIHELGVGRDQLGPLVQAYRFRLERGRGTPVRLGGAEGRPIAPEQAGQALSRHLLGPVESILGTYSRIVQVPNGPLHFLPLGALPWKGGYLAQKVELIRLSAASLLATDAKEEGTAGLLALAVPQREGWSPLPDARMEVESIARLYGHRARLLIGSEATKTRLVGRDLSGYSLHLATHAVAASPEATYLVLHDGELKVDEVWGLYLDGSPLVVLSACETNIGSLLSGDEVVN